MLIPRFKYAGGGIRESVLDTNLVWKDKGRSVYSGPVPIHRFQENLTCVTLFVTIIQINMSLAKEINSNVTWLVTIIQINRSLAKEINSNVTLLVTIIQINTSLAKKINSNVTACYSYSNQQVTSQGD